MVEDKDQRMKRLVELSTAEQCLNLFKNGVIQKSRKETGYPIIHGVVYDLSDGFDFSL